MRFLLRYLAGRRWLLAAVLLMTMSISALAVAVDPLAMRWLVDHGLAERDGTALVGALGLLLGLGISVRLVDYGCEMLLVRLINHSVSRLVGDTLRVFYKTPYARLLEHGDAYFVSRVYEEPSALVRGGLRLILDLATNVISALVALAIAAWLSWKITILLVVLGPPLMILAQRFHRRMVRLASAECETEGALREVMKRATGSHRTVALFGLQAAAAGSVATALTSHLGALYRRSASATGFRTASGLVMAVAETGVLIAAARAVFVHDLTVGGLFAYMTVFWRAMRCGEAALASLSGIAALDAAVLRLAELETPPAGETILRLLPMSAGEPLELREVSFDHGARRVLDRLSLRIDPGQRVLVVGPNGSGKTTLAHVLAGLLHGRGDARVHDPAQVSAMLNPLRFAPCSLETHLGLPTDERARADAMSLLRELELADRLADDPETFSDGLQRRAYVAMVLLKDAQVYIFDEPLAAVDEAGKDRVMAIIEARTRGKTVVSIMHGDQRFSSMFQRVVQLDPPAADAPLAVAG